MTDEPTRTWMVSPLDRMTPEERARHDAARALATEIFGNDISASVWASRFHKAVLGGKQPREVQHTPEGYADTIAELERIRPTITPEPGPDFAAIAQRKKRRR